MKQLLWLCLSAGVFCIVSAITGFFVFLLLITFNGYTSAPSIFFVLLGTIIIFAFGGYMWSTYHLTKKQYVKGFFSKRMFPVIAILVPPGVVCLIIATYIAF